MANTTGTTVQEIQAQIDLLVLKKREIQDQCQHPLFARDTVNKSDTGNWDRGQDSYWTEHHCRVCEKRWNTDQD